jgi:hypothetical protein
MIGHDAVGHLAACGLQRADHDSLEDSRFKKEELMVDNDNDHEIKRVEDGTTQNGVWFACNSSNPTHRPQNQTTRPPATSPGW